MLIQFILVSEFESGKYKISFESKVKKNRRIRKYMHRSQPLKLSQGLTKSEGTDIRQLKGKVFS